MSAMFRPSDDYYAFEELDPSILALLKKITASKATTEVLDVGCGKGLLGEALSHMGCRVTGVESHATAAAESQKRLARVVEHDLTQAEGVINALGGQTFDVIVFADVLEHLPDPLGTLELYKQYLAEDGCMMISVPNVAVWDVRLKLFFGAFNYGDAGVMDRTHLRFFTLRTIKLLLQEAGLEVKQVSNSPGIVRAFLPLIKLLYGGGKSGGGDASTLMNSSPYRLYTKTVLPIERAVAQLFKGLFAFRLLLIAKK